MQASHEKHKKAPKTSLWPLTSIAVLYFLCVFVFFVARRPSNDQQIRNYLRRCRVEIFAAREAPTPRFLDQMLEIGHRGEFALRFAQLSDHFDLPQTAGSLNFVPD